MKLWQCSIILLALVLIVLGLTAWITAGYNLCRDNGGDRFYCMTGLK